MNISVHIRQLLALIVIVLMCACNETDELPTQQMGRVEVRLVAPYRAATRATGDWLDPVDSKEKIHQWWVAFVNSSNIVQELVSGDAEGKEQDVFTFLLPPGTYTVYGFANLDNFNALGITKGAALPDLSKKTLATTNGWTENIPMSSHSGGQTVKVQEAENQSFQVELIRAMAKLELNFINKYQQQMDILGYKITPLTKTSVSLLEPTTPSAIVTADDNIEAHEVDLQSAPLVLAKDNGTATSYVYVNETNATATSTVNQYSIQLKVQRHQTVGGSDMTHEVEYRYGFTMNSSTVVDGVAGFDYIRRNDWIHIPVQLSDWQFSALPAHRRLPVTRGDRRRPEHHLPDGWLHRPASHVPQQHRPRRRVAQLRRQRRGLQAGRGVHRKRHHRRHGEHRRRQRHGTGAHGRPRHLPELFRALPFRRNSGLPEQRCHGGTGHRDAESTDRGLLLPVQLQHHLAQLIGQHHAAHNTKD